MAMTPKEYEMGGTEPDAGVVEKFIMNFDLALSKPHTHSVYRVPGLMFTKPYITITTASVHCHRCEDLPSASEARAIEAAYKAAGWSAAKVTTSFTANEMWSVKLRLGKEGK